MRYIHRIGNSCYFCNKPDYKLFYSLPFYRFIRMKPESLPTGIELTYPAHLAFAWQAKRDPL